MGLNNGGQAIFVGLMISVVVIILALALAGPLRETITTARNETSGDTIGLNCTSSEISTFDQATCLITDISLPYFIGGLILIGGAIAVAKLTYES